jgi:glycosyltransferase involved in cell wall biosynthesis
MLRPDLVHGQGSEGDAAICAAYSGYPNVITLLGIMREMAKVLKARAGSFYWFASGLENMSLRRTAGVLCNSRYTQERVRRRTRKTWLVPNAIREAFFEPPARVVASAKCVLLNVGAVSSYKRQNELLDMAEQLHEEGLRFQLHFIGAANPQNCYSADFLRRVQNSSYLSYEGVKSVSELIDSYDGAAALVHVSAIETFGLVVAEALSRNLKVFGFASGGVADITQGVAGAETFSDGDWLGLKAAIANWIRAGFPRPVPAACLMKERYHPTEIAQQHLEVYREVLGTPQ